MRKIVLLNLLVILTACTACYAQSSIFVRNNTWLDFSVTVIQNGTHVVPLGKWTQKAAFSRLWETDKEIFVTNRDTSTVPAGDTVYYEVTLWYNLSQVTLKFRLAGNPNGTQLAYAAKGPGFSDPWVSDGNFHQNSFTLAGRQMTIKYKPINDDTGQSRDLLFVIHENQPVQIDSVDFANPNVLNLMGYNIQMLPLGISGLPQAALRGDLMPGIISPWLDVMFFAEAFDPTPRTDHLIPAMQAAGFPYNSGILNDYFPFNGGVIIFSRWPIEATDDYDFLLCGPNAGDCFANKGIKYARINKLGKKYHIFGTHMDAGSDAQDLLAKNLQMAEMRDFIDVQNIPPNEAVLYGGDFNVSPTSGYNQYANMLDSLHPFLPYATGFFSSTMDRDTCHIIDHIWGSRKHLIPLRGTNQITSLRSIDDAMWDLSEYSDHRACYGRFTYPDISFEGGDTVLCPGENITYSVSSSIQVDYQWEKDGNAISGATSSTYSLTNAQPSDGGNYVSHVQYEVITGDSNDFLTPYFFPNGPDTVQADLALSFGQLIVDYNLCMGIGFAEELETEMRIWPNPARESLIVEWNETWGEGQAELWGLQGNSLAKWVLIPGKNNLKLKGIPPGIYLLKLNRGSQYACRRVLIE
ncbi:MAG: T9SS type A sorting domain-containing protein [Bacteroidia bacterium]|nr:T9SS type A sorting domain-containing protein [Bacteroidia bacterium]